VLFSKKSPSLQEIDTQTLDVRNNKELILYKSTLDLLPANVLICDATSGRITYANECAQRRSGLKNSPEQLVGSKIEAAFGVPIERFRSMLTNDGNTAKTRVLCGENTLECSVQKLCSDNASETALVILWRNVTGDALLAAQTKIYTSVVENIRQSIVLYSLDDMTITYVNSAATKTLRLLSQNQAAEHQWVGKQISLLPGLNQVRQTNTKQQSYTTTVKNEQLEWTLISIHDTEHMPLIGIAVLTLVTAQQRILDRVRSIGTSISRAATSITETAEGMASTANQTSMQASAVAAASEEASVNVMTVASSSETLSSSINEITNQVAQLATVAKHAAKEASLVDGTMHELALSAEQIGEVIGVIGSISTQIKLLALNATIEAARAGAAGRGFGVVAVEVTNMVDQTAQATAQIAEQITAIQKATDAAVQAIAGIRKTIEQMDESSTVIAHAVEKQGMATGEISRNVNEAAVGTQDVSSNISGVTASATENAKNASEMRNSAAMLNERAHELHSVSEELETYMQLVQA